MGEEIWNYIAKIGALWGFIGAIIVLLVNLYFTSRGKKEELRPYIEVLRVVADPLLHKGALKKGGKMILTDELKKYLSEQREDSGSKSGGVNLYPTFLKVKNISSNPCFGLKVKGIKESGSIKNTFIDMEFYVLKGDDELYIPLETPNSSVYNQVTLEVEYKTVANEKMIYKNKTTSKNGKELELLQSIYVVKKWGRDERIVETTASNIEWQIIK
ncbi:hypothetical protein ICA_02275 [Bacillus cereus BAG1O-3]|uniref:hypothetical protein n=1 Tax=Bacillus TaxID=1386 RepID=UPI000352CD0D|nr:MULTISPECIES: hypothetical protein [Bacillus]EPF11813.1 hypothetical protein ICA_02275 [Bacillus cereus BAG1O-3]MDR4414755.1 hypothetical protein [Bacillus thuringiensis]PFG82218.1 hypothetical protein DL97_1843 [Bacillus sp. YF23]